MDALYVRNAFTDFIKKKTIMVNHAEQRKFLLTHERRHIAETNILKEIKSCQLRFGARFQKKQLDLLIEAGASVFCDCALAAKIKELMTEADLKLAEQKAGEIADTQQWVDDMKKEFESTTIKKYMGGHSDGRTESTGTNPGTNTGNREAEKEANQEIHTSQVIGDENGHKLAGSGSNGPEVLPG